MGLESGAWVGLLLANPALMLDLSASGLSSLMRVLPWCETENGHVYTPSRRHQTFTKLRYLKSREQIR
jgi:hypothetical protein